MMPKKQKSLLLKLSVVVALLWLAFILFIGNDSALSDDRYGRNEHMQSHHASWGNDLNALDGSRQPVIARPDPDRLRFEAVMRKDAEEEAKRRKNEELEKQRLEEERRRRIQGRAVPPFMNMQNFESVKKSTNATVINGVDLSTVDDLTRRLIEKGLLVPKWNLEKEVAANPNGTGAISLLFISCWLDFKLKHRALGGLALT